MIDEYELVLQKGRMSDKADFLNEMGIGVYTNPKVFTKDRYERFKKKLDRQIEMIDKYTKEKEELENLPARERSWKKTQSAIDSKVRFIERCQKKYEWYVFHGKNLGWVKGDEEE
tara:strand:+ start:389 stop:733 length:345 start_codon:yes stop_codon:yes gene_type:complete